MNKNEMTVTMSLANFEELQSKIELLSNNSIFNFLERDYPELYKSPKHIVLIDVDKIKQYVKEQDQNAIDVKVLYESQ